MTSGEKTEENSTISDESVAERRPGIGEVREQRRAEAEEKKAEARVNRAHQKRVRELEQAIAKLEQRQRELATELEKPETYEPGGPVMELNRELQGVISELEKLTANWLEL